MNTNYDYIITGAGCAGMSVLMRMMQDDFFADKKILVIDATTKNTNDRTWCFWEQQPGVFESIVFHRWNQLQFHSNGFSVTAPLAPYQYKMIRGIDLYTQVQELAATRPLITWKTEQVLGITHFNGIATVQLASGNITAPFVVNSILFTETSLSANQSGAYHLLQHFKGWLIETSQDCFQPNIATFMDFRVSQQAGTTFVYVLPVSKRKALVEYTLFSGDLLSAEAYDEALRSYIEHYITCHSYTIEHTEWGVIPMTNHRFTQQEGPVKYIGTAGGQVKASSGFAFQFIQKKADEMVRFMKAGTINPSAESFCEKKFRLYDSVLLNVLSNEQMAGDQIFTALFRKNPVQRIFRFLDNKSSLGDDFSIMASVPTRVFLPAALQEML
ncbi:MAG: lycopene cyclase family protein [Chitinophagia bacterium]